MATSLSVIGLLQPDNKRRIPLAATNSKIDLFLTDVVLRFSIDTSEDLEINQL
jgi:hypothetical protein